MIEKEETRSECICSATLLSTATHYFSMPNQNEIQYTKLLDGWYLQNLTRRTIT